METQMYGTKEEQENAIRYYQKAHRNLDAARLLKEIGRFAESGKMCRN